jgi:hypothetical protein
MSDCAARKSQADDYGLILEGATLGVSDVAMRPGEVFALHRSDIHFSEKPDPCALATRPRHRQDHMAQG